MRLGLSLLQKRGLQRALFSLLAVLGMTVATTSVAVVTSPVAAFANTPSGSVTMNVPAGGSAYAGWRSSDRYLNLSTTPTAIVSGWCQVTMFDWTRSGGGHFDSRLVRSCVSYTFYSQADYWEPSGSYTLLGKQKLGVCRGQQYLEKHYTCVEMSEPGFSIQSVPLNSTYCARTWQLNAPGSTTFKTGGVFTSCTS